MVRITSRSSLFGILSAIAFIVWLPSIQAGFTADDFVFLRSVQQTDTSLSYRWPIGLHGQFFRPATVVSFAVEQKLWGLIAWPYHFTNLALHILSGIFVYELAQVFRFDSRVAALSAVLFVTFGGHGEAVAWISGRGDVLATAMILLSALAGALAVQSPSGHRFGVFAAVSLGALSVGLLAKESAVAAPVLIALVALQATSNATERHVFWRRLAPLVATITAGYIICRWRVLGSVLGGYQISTFNSASGVLGNVCDLLLASFVPPGPLLRHISHYRIGTALAISAWAIGAVIRWTRHHRIGRVDVLVGCLLLALAPAITLPISLSDGQGERFVYLGTAFAAIITASALSAARPSLLKIVLVCAIVAANGLHAADAARRWREASSVAATVLNSTAALMSRGPMEGLVFVLNLPDNVRGAYVFRNGFADGLRMRNVNPDPVVVVSTQTLSSSRDPVTVRQLSPRSYVLEIYPNTFLIPPPSGPFYSVTSGGNQARIDFTDAAVRALVLAVSSGAAVHVAEWQDADAPFGIIDTPAEGVSCSGDSVRFAGWALSKTRPLAVRIEMGDWYQGSATPPGWRQVGTAAWFSGDRPDVAAAYPSYSERNRAEWRFWLACGSVTRPGAIVRVVATDDLGVARVLGTRRVVRQ
ncbi:MAG: hypothetical protein H0U13_16925 [Gemmatimonadaceae bacterium]|nr:hypothetical protein [Gemmatimonadaceae bacterium]